MVRNCYVCKRYFNREIDRSFHRFPKDPEVRNKWLKVLELEECDVKLKYASVCSDHFYLSDFVVTASGRRNLKHDALPALSIRNKAQSDVIRPDMHISTGDDPIKEEMLDVKTARSLVVLYQRISLMDEVYVFGFVFNVHYVDSLRIGKLGTCDCFNCVSAPAEEDIELGDLSDVSSIATPCMPSSSAEGSQENIKAKRRHLPRYIGDCTID
ncbi:hypothetical protein NQ318_023304 [Aromia moschata]|uniref:THAP-type domain-containing protein n=1 Tax=Aromia moschata TaxID=1265417 RepID=A0AAV8XRM4_9CUCU|nr:hypothetical protein NQ318_023304 [Aromia moschata]